MWLTNLYFFVIIEDMARRDYFGEFELMVMLAILRLEGDAYGVPIAAEMEAFRGRDVALGSVYAALERLESKGYVRSWMGEATAERGGKAKRYFKVTANGLKAVGRTRKALTAMWKRIPVLKKEEA